MIKKQFVLTLILWCSLVFTWTNPVLFAQEIETYDWEEVQAANPDTIYAISFQKDKLVDLPEDLSKFVNLKKLDLSKNKLSELPSFIGSFDSLQVLNLEKNKFSKFPIEICQLTELKSLLIGSNDIAAIPDCIEYASNIEFLDLYDNPLGYLPQSVVRLKKLKKIDFTGIRFNKNFQKQWTEQLSNVELVFDSPCNCMN